MSFPALPPINPLELAVENHFFNKKVDKVRHAAKKILNQTERMIKSSMAAGFSGMSMQQIEFFNHMRLLLQDYLVVYSDILDQTVETISDEASKQLYQIDAMVHNWATIIDNPDVQKVVQQIQAIAANLIIVRNHPVVTAFYPPFVTPFHKDSFIYIECVGLFPSAASANMTPKLLIGENKFTPVSNLIGKLVFSIPFNTLFPDSDTSTKSEIRTAHYSVQIPYLDKGWIYNCIVSSRYDAMMVLLPESPGTVTINSARVKEVEEKKPITSLPLTPTSINLNHRAVFGLGFIQQTFTLSAPENYKIVKDSSQFHVEGVQVNPRIIQWTREQDLPTHVTYNVMMPVMWARQPQLKFRISAIVTRTIKSVESAEKKIVLKWGESIPLDPTSENFSVEYHAFDGTTQHLTTNTFGRYLHLVLIDGRPTIKVKSEEELSTFNFHRLLTTAKL